MWIEKELPKKEIQVQKLLRSFCLYDPGGTNR